MTQERWQQVESVYHEALEHDPANRPAYLARACGNDQDLLKEVNSLLDRDPSSPDNLLNQPLGDTLSLAAGTRFGPYEILSAIGAGGMGEVWKALDTRLGRTVALKTSRVGFSAQSEKEARAVASLNHPNICTLYDVGPNYFVMEYIEGRPLRELIPRKGLPLTQVLNYAAQITDALAAAHAAGIIHRDLKPGNIMVTPDDRVKVVDFGLARMAAPVGHSDTTLTSTGEGTIAGTVSYMSPEQAQGRSLDARSDIFSFGAVLYEMLTGVRAFPGDSAMSTMADIIHKDPRPIREVTQQLPAEMETLLARCLRKDPARRWQNMADLKVALLDLKDESTSGKLQPASLLTQSRKRRWPGIAAAALPAVALIAAAVWLVPLAPRTEVWSGSLLGGPIIASHPRISPDGQLLTFRAIIDGQSQVAVMKPDASSWTVLTHDKDKGSMHYAAWARDGSKIYFDREGTISIYSIPPLGGEQRLILQNATAPEPLPDGSLIVLRPSSDGRLQLLHFWPDSGRQEAFPAKVSPVDSRVVCAFPDGKEVAVFGYNGPNDGARHLFVLDVATGKGRNLAGPEDLGGTGAAGEGASRRPHSVAVSADGRSVLTLINRNDTLFLVALPRDGSGHGRVLISFPVSAPPLAFDSAPDGSIYADQSSFSGSVLKISQAGKMLSETRIPNDAFSSLPLPDGSFLFMLMRGGRLQLLAAAPGAEPHTVFNTEEDVRFPCALLGNDKLVFLIGKGEQTRLAIGSLADGRILYRFPHDAQWLNALAASADGRTIYYAADGSIWAQPVSGGDPHKIGEGYDAISDPSGRYLYALRVGGSGYELWRTHLNDGSAEKVDVPPGYRLASDRISAAAVNADGRILLQVNTPDIFFYQSAVLDPLRHTASLVPAPPQAVAVNAGWTADGCIQVLVTHWSSMLWRYRALPRESAGSGLQR